eukprot:1319841-Amorphochlora_amoeboformis.AAC.2
MASDLQGIPGSSNNLPGTLLSPRISRIPRVGPHGTFSGKCKNHRNSRGAKPWKLTEENDETWRSRKRVGLISR